MDDLIARLEAATEGSRELDAEIFCLLDPAFITHKKAGGYVIRDTGSPSGNRHLAESPFISRSKKWPPNYTGSIDAALTLVPEGHGVGMVMNTVGSHTAAAIYLTDEDAAHERARAHGRTPALALCIAALKARADD